MSTYSAHFEEDTPQVSDAEEVAVVLESLATSSGKAVPWNVGTTILVCADTAAWFKTRPGQRVQPRKKGRSAGKAVGRIAGDNLQGAKGSLSDFRVWPQKLASKAHAFASDSPLEFTLKTLHES